MARFEIEYNGQRFEVEAPDQETAIRALDGYGKQSPQARYDEALGTIRSSQFPQMTDQQWADYSRTAFSPADFQDTAQAAQLFGFGDEINAGLGALGSQVRQWTGGGGPGFGEAYDQYSRLEQSRRDLGREQLGAGALAADVVGGFSAFGPARGAGGLPISVPLSQPQTYANAVFGGSIMGAVGGFGTADEERANAAAIGGGIGTVIGRFGPAVGNAVSSGYENVANLLARNSAARDVGISPGVAGFIGETLASDDTLTAAGLARMSAAGQESMLADAGPSARRMLDTAIQSSGRAGNMARTAITERVTRDSQAIQDALNATLGMPEGITSARARIAAETAGDRSTLYRAAYEQPIDYSSGSGMLLEELLARVPQQAINRANTLMRVRGERSPQIMAQFADDGSVTFMQMPDVRQIDYITRALREEASAGIGQGAMGGQTDIGSSLNALATDIRSTLGNHIPEYEQALNLAGDTIQRSQAVNLGADLLNPATTMDDIIRRSQTLSPAEREGIAVGLRSQIDNLIARVTRTLGNSDTEAREAAKTLIRLSDRATRTKIEAAIGEEMAAPLFAELDRAGMSFELAASVADNSATFARQEMNRRMGDLAGGTGPVDTLRQGEPLNASKRIIQALTGMTPDAILRRKDQYYEEAARLLTARGPEALRNWQIMQALTNQQFTSGAIGDALRSGIQTATLPTANVASQRYIAGSQ